MAKTPVELVDQLAEVRAEIRALKQVEESLRQALLARPGRTYGRDHIAIAEAKRTRRFDPKLLPQLTYAEPRFWTTKVTKIVRILPRHPTARPEGRARSSAAPEYASKAGAFGPPQGAGRHIVPDSLGPEDYCMSNDFWDRL